MKLDWQQKEGISPLIFVAQVPITSPLGGSYEIWITQRPSYCDRGDWLIYVDGRGPGSCLDGADGFPRYFFGSEAEAKAQMETWASRREECR